uniref:SRCR domain-containing protein n=1 Tax=Xiphophorus couchianus TaxID=32473 RepID=A0A3B5KNL4_9TELE
FSSSVKNENNDNPCEGHVEVYYGNEMGHVGDKNWNEKTDEVVCRSTHCGRPVRKSNVYRAFNSTVWLNELECRGDEASLWDCDGWPGPKVSFYRNLEVRLQDGPGKCAGLLEVKDEGQWKRVSKEGWDASYTQRACRLLDCGDAGKDKLDSDEFSQGTAAMLTFSCKEADKNLTDCKTTKTNNQNRNEKALLFLDGPQSCSGYVAIEYKEELYWLSGSNETWNTELANKVCQQMHCGKASSFSPRFSEDKNRMWEESFSCSSDHKSIFDCNKKQINSNNSAIAHVKCEGNEHNPDAIYISI